MREDHDRKTRNALATNFDLYASDASKCQQSLNRSQPLVTQHTPKRQEIPKPVRRSRTQQKTLILTAQQLKYTTKNIRKSVIIVALHSFETNWSILKFATGNRKLAPLSRRYQIFLLLLSVHVKDL